MGIQHRFAKSCASNPIIISIVRVDKSVLCQVGNQLQHSVPSKPIILLSIEI